MLFIAYVQGLTDYSFKVNVLLFYKNCTVLYIIYNSNRIHQQCSLIKTFSTWLLVYLFDY